jgi:hypothetical protein
MSAVNGSMYIVFMIQWISVVLGYHVCLYHSVHLRELPSFQSCAWLCLAKVEATARITCI